MSSVYMIISLFHKCVGTPTMSEAQGWVPGDTSQERCAALEFQGSVIHSCGLQRYRDNLRGVPEEPGTSVE